MNLLLGITGSVAAFKALRLGRILRDRGHQLRVILTRGGAQFVTPLSVSSLLGAETFTDQDFWAPVPRVLHIELARWADLFILAPATFHTLSKWALGLADDLLTSTLAAYQGPVVFAPAMHTEMWTSPVLQQHLLRIEGLGGVRVGPTEGPLASGDHGIGRMVEPEEIAEVVEQLLALHHTLRGKKLLIVYGRTEEDLDPVRVITNRSSGKMGAALVRWAHRMGAEVSSIVGSTSIQPPQTPTLIRVRTTDEMLEAVQSHFPQCDALIMVAAVADYRPTERHIYKRKKEKEPHLTLSLETTPDILQSLLPSKKHQLIVGFALETDMDLKAAEQKRKTKGMDLMVLNTPQTLGVETVTGSLLDEQGSTPFEGWTKDHLARQILAWLANRWRRG